MNFQPSTPMGGLHRTLRVLSLLLLQHALAPTGTRVQAGIRLPENRDADYANDSESRPYLKIAGSVPLRFASAPRPVPNLVAHPVAASHSSSQPSTEVPTSLNPTPLSPNVEPEKLSDDPITPSTAPEHNDGNNNKSVLSILPDDTRPSTRPEDFLPFFQFPGGGDVTVIAPAQVTQPPAPGQLPASSATYQQR